jgi:hypothetical protein
MAREKGSYKFLSETAIITGITLIVAAIAGISGLTLPGVNLLPGTYLSMQWAASILTLIAGIVWLFVGARWYGIIK